MADIQEAKRICPIKAIRLKCLDCSGGSSVEVARCTAENCPLWHYRFGKNPFRKKRELSEEQKAEMRERFARARATRLIM